MEKNYWNICASHDGYTKQYGVIHERQIEFFLENSKFVGQDKLIKKKNFKNSNCALVSRYISRNNINYWQILLWFHDRNFQQFRKILKKSQIRDTEN